MCVCFVLPNCQLFTEPGLSNHNNPLARENMNNQIYIVTYKAACKLEMFFLYTNGESETIVFTKLSK